MECFLLGIIMVIISKVHLGLRLNRLYCKVSPHLSADESAFLVRETFSAAKTTFASAPSLTMKMLGDFASLLAHSGGKCARSVIAIVMMIMIITITTTTAAATSAT